MNPESGRRPNMILTNRDNEPHARRLRGGRISQPFQTYFITKCVEDRRPILEAPAAAEIVIESWVHVRNEGAIKLFAFVVMPDHYHVIFTLLPGDDLGALMRRVGSFTSNQIRKALGLAKGIWQDDGFHDHGCRHEKDVLELVEYVHHNPVRKGLASRAEDWLFSSAYPSRRGVLDWDWWV